jgi:hypothetical protein
MGKPSGKLVVPFHSGNNLVGIGPQGPDDGVCLSIASVGDEEVHDLSVTSQTSLFEHEPELHAHCTL